MQQLFPRDAALSEMRVESYLGAALRDRDGKVLGILVALHSAPLEDPDSAGAILRVFANRAAAELEREAARVKLEEQSRRLEAYFESAAQGVLTVDAGGRVMQVNRALERMFGYRREEIVGQSQDVLIPRWAFAPG